MQEERGPRKQKRMKETLEKPFDGTELTIGSSMGAIDNIASNFHYQFLSQILVTCIKQAKLNENFRLFSQQQQKFILSNVWSECFVLRASHWSIDINPIIEQYVFNWVYEGWHCLNLCWTFHTSRCNEPALKAIIDETKKLKADLIEVSLLETLILCRKGTQCFVFIFSLTSFYLQFLIISTAFC